ncbi:hypothetical protein NDU88_000345 [Pleurodeles waltl]|uniref:Lamina-associated polypeptide 2 alpha C-terminal domain-containing protein n=1 Tax=Pleurodeles waltl TaxID=8319 RepID=A0AAV7WF84_PLEWA|nr:hypothetical protein NDU88_000345 [Pleurodeles waltl]
MPGDAGPCKAGVETLLFGQPGTAGDAGPCRAGVETLLFGQPSTAGDAGPRLEWRPSSLGSPARQVMLDPAPAGLEWRPSSLGSPARQVMLDPGWSVDPPFWAARHARWCWTQAGVETLLFGQPGTAGGAGPCPCRPGVETLLFGHPGTAGDAGPYRAGVETLLFRQPGTAGDAGPCPCRAGVETLLFGHSGTAGGAGPRLEWRPSSLGSLARQVVLDPVPAGLEWRPSSLGIPARQVMLDPTGLEWRPSSLGIPAQQVMLDPAPAGLEWRPSSLGSPAQQVMLDPAGLEWRPSSLGSPALQSLQSSEEEGPGHEEQKGKYIAQDMLPDLIRHVKANIEFPDEEVSDRSSGSLLCQFQSLAPIDVLVHPYIHGVLKGEWRDHGKILLQHTKARLYFFQDIQTDLPDSIPIDSFVASLVGWTSLEEHAVIKDAVDKRVDALLGKVHSGSHLALRAGIYGTYVSRSLITDIKALFRSLDDSSDCSGLLDKIETQVEYLSDVSFDVIRASALSGGTCVAARWNLFLKDWKTDLAQKASALWLPFQGNLLYGPELEDTT